MVNCGGQTYAVSTNLGSDQTFVSRIGTVATTVATVPATSDVPSLACGSDQRPMLLLPAQPSVLLTAANAYHVTSTDAGPSAAIAAAGGPTWLVDDRAGTLRVSTLTDKGQPASGVLTLRAVNT